LALPLVIGRGSRCNRAPYPDLTADTCCHLATVARLAAAPSILDAARASYDIETENTRLVDVLKKASAEDRATGFDRLRKEQPRRRECKNWRVGVTEIARGIVPQLEALVFFVED
jgi:hypothetical protein